MKQSKNAAVVRENNRKRTKGRRIQTVLIYEEDAFGRKVLTDQKQIQHRNQIK